MTKRLSATRLALAIVLLLTAAAPAVAQVPTSPRHVGEGRYAYPGEESPIDNLSRLLKAGNWTRLQHYGQELITTLWNQANLKPLLGDPQRDFYNLVWTEDGDDGKPVVRRLLVHRGLAPQHGTTLPGVKTKWPDPEKTPPPATGIVPSPGPDVLDVLLSDSSRASLTSTYVFTPVPDPIVTQLPDVINKLNVLGFLARAAGTSADTANTITVYVNQPDIVMRRGTIAIADVVSTRITADQLKNKADKTLASVTLRQARTSPCAKVLALHIKNAIDTTAATPACQAGDEVCARALKAIVEASVKAVVPNCAAEPAGGVDPIAAVEAEFKQVVAAGGAQIVRGQSALTNTPPTRLSFGLMTALLVGDTTLKEDRVKVDSNKIVKAPLDRSMTMVVLNVHPWRYDANWPEVSWAERARFFVGGVLTPDFGVSAGVGLGLVRGLTVNAGGAFLFLDTAKSDEKIGEEPKNGNDPFKTRVGLGGFIGLSYTFK